jgi:hypothetical protein
MQRAKPLNGRMLATYRAGVLKTENYVNNDGYEEYANGNWQERCRGRPIKELAGAPKYRCERHTSPSEHNHARIKQRKSRSGVCLQLHASGLTTTMSREQRRFAVASRYQRLVRRSAQHSLVLSEQPANALELFPLLILVEANLYRIARVLTQRVVKGFHE